MVPPEEFSQEAAQSMWDNVVSQYFESGNRPIIAQLDPTLTEICEHVWNIVPYGRVQSDELMREKYKPVSQLVTLANAIIAEGIPEEAENHLAIIRNVLATYDHFNQPQIVNEELVNFFFHVVRNKTYLTKHTDFPWDRVVDLAVGDINFESRITIPLVLLTEAPAEMVTEAITREHAGGRNIFRPLDSDDFYMPVFTHPEELLTLLERTPTGDKELARSVIMALLNTQLGVINSENSSYILDPNAKRLATITTDLWNELSHNDKASLIDYDMFDRINTIYGIVQQQKEKWNIDPQVDLLINEIALATSDEAEMSLFEKCMIIIRERPTYEFPATHFFPKLAAAINEARPQRGKWAMLLRRK